MIWNFTNLHQHLCHSTHLALFPLPVIEQNKNNGIRINKSSATAEIAWVGGHYAVQGHSRSLILIPIESPYATSYQWIIPRLTYILSRNICQVSRRIDQNNYRFWHKVPLSNVFFFETSANVIMLTKTRFIGLHFSQTVLVYSTFIHFDIIWLQNCPIRENNAK